MSNLQAVKQEIKDTKVLTVFDFMESKRDLIAKVIPNTITTDRLIGIFTMILRGNPELLTCTQNSLIAAVIQTVQLGLTPGSIGHIHLLPFNNKQKDGSFRKEVQLIIGYRGLCELVNRSNRACILMAEVVRENDEFVYELGLNPQLKHVFAQGPRGDIKGVYAIAKNLMANEKVFVYLQKGEIEKVKATSKGTHSEYSPWNVWPDEMAKKTAVKRLCKMLPLSLEQQKKLSADETVKTEIASDMTEVHNEANWDIEAEIKEGATNE